MSDENNEIQGNQDHGQAGANTGTGEPSTPPRSANDDSIKRVQAQAYSHGYNESRKALLTDLGVESIETLKQTIEAQKQAELENEAKTLAEKTEREKLALELQESRKREKNLSAEAEKLHMLREQVKAERLKTLSLQNGIKATAIDLLMTEFAKTVSWDGDHRELIVRDSDGKESDFETLFKNLRETHPYVFEDPGKRGAGLSPEYQKRQAEWKPSYSSLEDRIKGF